MEFNPTTNQTKLTKKGTDHKDYSCTGTVKTTHREAENHRRTKVSEANLQALSEKNKFSGKISKKRATKLHTTSGSIRKYLVEKRKLEI